MPVWKRYKQKRVKRGDPDYNKGTWIAEGKVDGRPYKKALPRETVKTAEDARGRDDQIRAAIRSGDFQKKIGFAQFIDEIYLPYCKSNLDSYPNKVLETNSLKAFFKDRPLNTITLSTCEEYKRWRKSQKAKCQKCSNGLEHACEAALVKNSTVNRDLGTLSGAFKLAVADRKMRANPMELVPRLDEGDKRVRFLSPDEKARLWKELNKKLQLSCICTLAVLTGWRKEQILHLSKTDLIYGQKRVWVRKSKRKPRRDIVVGDMAWRILTALADQREHWLFLNPSGERLVEFNYLWWKALKNAGVADFRFHDLRHTFSTDLLDDGTPEFAIQHALGHSRLQTTQLYAHVKETHLKEALDRLSEGLDFDPSAILTPSGAVM
jgi:integrase